MGRILIAVESTSSSREYTHLGDVLQELGDDCRVLDNVYVLRTVASPDEIYNILLGGAINSKDKFIVVSLADTWIACNVPKEDDCIEHSSNLMAREAGLNPL